MDWKKLVAAGALGLSLLSAPAIAQNNTGAKVSTKSFKVEPMITPGKEESHTFRLSGSYGKDGFSAYGFLDLFGPDTDKYYGEIHLRYNTAKKSGLQLEINDGTGLPAVFRFGYIWDVLKTKRFYLNVKALPLNVSKAEIEKNMQLGTFASADLGKGFYAENWTDFHVPYRGKRFVFTEFTLGRKINDHLSLQVQVPYNTNSPGWAARVGLRYKF